MVRDHENSQIRQCFFVYSFNRENEKPEKFFEILERNEKKDLGKNNAKIPSRLISGSNFNYYGEFDPGSG